MGSGMIRYEHVRFMLYYYYEVLPNSVFKL